MPSYKIGLKDFCLVIDESGELTKLIYPSSKDCLTPLKTVELEILKEQYLSGKIVYVDSRFVLNHTKYVEEIADEYHLTKYAKSHPSECCVSFIDLKFGTSYPRKHKSWLDMLNEPHVGGVSFGFITSSKNDLPNIVYVPNGDEENYYEILNDVSSKTLKIISEMPNELGKAIKYLREIQKMTQETLEENSNVSVSTIRRIENEPNYVCEKLSLSRICVGLKLNSYIREALFNRSPHNLNNSQENLILRFILDDCYLDEISKFEDSIEILKNLKK